MEIGTVFANVDSTTLDECFSTLNNHPSNPSNDWCMSEFVGSSGFDSSDLSELGGVERSYGLVKDEFPNVSEESLDRLIEMAVRFPDYEVYAPETYMWEQPESDLVPASPKVGVTYSPSSLSYNDEDWSPARSVFDVSPSNDAVGSPDLEVPSSSVPSSPGFDDVPRTPVKHGKWTAEEDCRLQQAVQMYKGNWKKIARCVTDRTAQQCLHRWRKSVQPGISRTRWSDKEDERLRQAVMQVGTRWTKVQELVPGRTDVQCRERWVNILDPAICRDAWTVEEDQLLRAAVKELGAGKWSQISARMPRRRTDYGCRKRWEKLCRRNEA